MNGAESNREIGLLPVASRGQEKHQRRNCEETCLFQVFSPEMPS
jgi:hypothetical protein